MAENKAKRYTIFVCLVVLLFLINTLNFTPSEYTSYSQDHRVISPSATITDSTRATITTPSLTIESDTTYVNYTIRTDYIYVNDHSTLTLRNCTLIPFNNTRIFVKTNNYTNIYIEGSNISHIYFNYMTYINSNSIRFLDLNLTIRDSNITNLTILDTTEDGWGYLDHYYRNIYISDSYINRFTYRFQNIYYKSLKSASLTLYNNYIYEPYISIYENGDSLLNITHNSFDSKDSVPSLSEFTGKYNIWDMLGDISLIDKPTIDIGALKYSVATIILQDIIIYNIYNIMLVNITMNNVILNNIGNMVIANSVIDYMSSNVVYNQVLLTYYESDNRYMKISNSKFSYPISMGNLYGEFPLFDVQKTFIFDNCFIEELSILKDNYAEHYYQYTMANNTLLSLTDTTINTLSIMANQTLYYPDFLGVGNETVNFHVDIRSCDIGSFIGDNITSMTIRSTNIHEYTIFKNSIIDMYSTNYNAMEFYNSSINIYYRLTMNIYTEQNVLTKIYNKTRAVVYTSTLNEFSIELPSMSIDRSDNITYHYPYNITSLTISDEAYYDLDNFVRDEYIVVYLGLYRLDISLSDNKSSGWVLIPLSIDRPYSAVDLLKSSIYFRALLYEIGGNEVLLFKKTQSKIYGGDFELRPFSSVYVYVSISETEVILPVNFGSFNQYTVKIHYGINYISIPTTLTADYLFYKNQYITEITIYSDDGITTYTKYDENLNLVILKPTDGIIIYSTSDNKYLTL